MNNLFLLSSICFIAMVSPGPDLVLITRNSLSYSLKVGLATSAGIIAGCTMHATYCILGLALLIAQSVVLFTTIKYAGAMYLIYLGCRTLTQCRTVKALNQESSTVPDISLRDAFVQGLLCNLLNPKLAIFLLSLFTQFIPVDATLTEKSVVAGIFVGESIIYWPFIAVVLQLPGIKGLFLKVQTKMDIVCGILFVLLGLRVVFTEN